MEKGRPGAGKGRLKERVLPPSGDFIALGTKQRPQSTSTEGDLKPLQPLPVRKGVALTPASTSSQVTQGNNREKRKEIPGPLPPVIPGIAKQARLTPPSVFSPSQSSSKAFSFLKGFQNTSPVPAVTTFDVCPVDLEDDVIEADGNGDTDKVESLLCSAVKSLRQNRLKPDAVIYLSLLTLAKSKPELFQSRAVTEHVLIFLKREMATGAIKPKPNPLLCAMASNILLHSYGESENWPQSFIKVFVEDAIGDRSWVDNDHCKPFVDNILTAFGTVLPPKQTTGQGLNEKPKTVTIQGGTVSSTSISVISDEREKSTDEPLVVDGISLVKPRYTAPQVELAIQYYVLDVVKDQLNKRQMIDGVSRNMLRFLSTACGFADVRLLASQRLETWLQNPKLTRPAQDLLMAVSMNCNTHTSEDVDVIGNIVKMRLKTKPLANHYVNCVREMVNQHPENLGTTLKHVIYNELSQQRNPNNMSILSVIFQIEPENAAKYLALVFQDLLMNREDYLRALRALFREIVRSLRYEINFIAFCRALMQERTDQVFKDLDSNLKERMLMSLIDLVTMAALVSVSPAVKELAIILAKGNKRDTSVLQEFQTQISIIQRDCVWWFHTKIPNMFNCIEKDYVFGLNKVLFLESNDVYSNKDGWPPEADRLLLLNLMREVPLTEDGLLRLLVLGLSDEFPINCADTLDVVERLVQRSAVLKTGLPGLECDRTDVIEMVLSLCVYTYPKEISLPVGYSPPTLAISNLYWKAWLSLLILAACNPSTVGRAVWESYPTLRCIIEMIITGNYTYPPLETENLPAESVKAAERQLVQAEKEEVLLFETHLAAATTGQTITESNSLLINQLISLDPSGPPREPPAQTMDRLKQMNKSLALGYMFCRSRSPDFLLDIIQSQGSSTGMPWLADLVQASEGSLSVLPAQCLCEFLLMKDLKETEKEREDKKAIRNQVIARLRALIMGPESSTVTTKEVLEYFLSRLGSVKMKERNAAVQGLQDIIYTDEREPISVPMITEIKDLNNIEPDEDSTATTTSVTSETMADDDNKLNTSAKSAFAATNNENSRNKSYDWLLYHLPRLQYFPVLMQPLAEAMRQGFYVEMDIARLQAYVIFLARYIKDFPTDYINELIEDLSQLVTTRSTILTGLIDQRNPSGPDTFRALFEVYATALKKALEPENLTFEWQDNQEMVFVNWSAETLHGERSATLHVRVIHAAIVLLSCFSPVDMEVNDNYSLLLDTWFPEQGYCEVRLAETGEEALLLQDWLRMKMVRSHVPRLVEAGLQGLMSAQLILFMQTFGLPVLSMSKLLAILDEAAKDDPVDMLQAVVDRDYMIQLVEVQWARGAKNGKQFCSLLAQDQYPAESEMQNLEDLEDQFTPICVEEETIPKIRTRSGSDHLLNEDELRQIFSGSASVESNKRNVIVTQLKEKLAEELVFSNVGQTRSLGSTVVSVLNKIMTTDSDEAISVSFMSDTKLTPLLIDLLAKLEGTQPRRKENFVRFLQLANGRKKQGSPEVARCITNYCDIFGILRRASESEYRSWQEIKKIAMQIQEKSRQGINFSSEVKMMCEGLTDSVQAGQICHNDMEKKLLLQTCKVALESDSKGNSFKELINTICFCFLNMPKTDEVTSFTIIKSLIGFLADLYEHCLNIGHHIQSGLLVDWLELVDPEMVHVIPILQRELLFMTRVDTTDAGDVIDAPRSKSEEGDKSVSHHLMAVLAHHVRNGTLHDCLEWLLSLDISNKRLNPSSALDFIASVVNNPRLWRGRDSKRNYLDENKGGKMSDQFQLELSTPQLCTLAKFIVSEIDIYHSRSYPSQRDSSERDNVEGALDAPTFVDKRLTLLLNHTANLTTWRLRKIVKTVQQCRWISAKAIQCFLRQLYLKRPKAIINPQDVFTNDDVGSLIQGRNCQIDSIIHHLMLTVANSRTSTLKETKFQHINMICRRLAHDHPLLMLRQLPVFVTLLNGRHRLPPKEFAGTNQMHLFAFIFGILNLLRPYIFNQDKGVEEGLSAVIDVFMDLIQSPCLQPTDLTGILNKLVDFLTQLITNNPSYALRLLMKYRSVFEDFLADFPNSPPLNYLCTFLVMMNSVSGQNQSFIAAPTVPSVTTPFSEKNLAVFRQKLGRSDQISDVINALKDLDDTSKRRIDILQHFVEEISSLLWSPSAEVREKAYVLLLRQCRHNAKDANVFARTILSILEGEDHPVIGSAAKVLPQFLLATNEHGEVLLRKLFQLATSSQYELAPFVEQCISNLAVDF